MGSLVDILELILLPFADHFVALERQEHIDAPKDVLDLPGMFRSERTGIGDERAPVMCFGRRGRTGFTVAYAAIRGDPGSPW